MPRARVHRELYREQKEVNEQNKKEVTKKVWDMFNYARRAKITRYKSSHMAHRWTSFAYEVVNIPKGMSC